MMLMATCVMLRKCAIGLKVQDLMGVRFGVLGKKGRESQSFGGYARKSAWFCSICSPVSAEYWSPMLLSLCCSASIVVEVFCARIVGCVCSVLSA